MIRIQGKIQKWKSIVHYRWAQHRQVLLILLPLLFFFPMVKIIQLLQPVEPLDRLTQLYENKEYDSLYALSVKHQFDFPLDQEKIIYYQALSGLLKNTEEPAPFFQLLYLDRTGRYTSKLMKKVNSEKPQTRFAGMFISFLSSQGALDKDSIKPLVKNNTIWTLDYVNRQQLFDSLSVILPERIHKLSQEKELFFDKKEVRIIEPGSLLLLRDRVDEKVGTNQSQFIQYLVLTEHGEQGIIKFSKTELEKIF